MSLIDITAEGVSVPHRDPDHTLKRPIFDGKNAGEKSNRRDPRASQTSWATGMATDEYLPKSFPARSFCKGEKPTTKQL